MNIRLIVSKQLKLLGCEVSRLKCYLESVRRLWWLLDMVKISSVDFLEKIKSMLETRFLSC